MASVKIPEQKVILCGEFGVGKSSLFRRYMSDSFTTATDRFEGKFEDLVTKRQKTSSTGSLNMSVSSLSDQLSAF